MLKIHNIIKMLGYNAGADPIMEILGVTKYTK